MYVMVRTAKPHILKAVRAVGLALVAQLLLLSSASADYRDNYPKQFSMSPKGVNIQTGRLNYQQVDVTAGPLKLVRSLGDGSFSNTIRRFGLLDLVGSTNGWTHNYASGIKIDTSTNVTYYRAVADGTQYNFKQLSDGSLVPGDASTQGTRIDTSSGQWVVTDHSGNQYTFTQSGTNPIVLQRALYANGSAISYTYNANWQPKLVSSNLGYAIVLDYDANQNISAACAFNTTQVYVSSATTCSGSPAYVGKASYGYNGGGARLTSVTDVHGGVTTYSYNEAGTGAAHSLSCISLVNSAACAMQNTYAEGVMTGPDQVTTQTTATGSVWHYDYTPTPNPIDDPPKPCWPVWADGSMTDPGGQYTGALYDRGYLVRLNAPDGESQYLYPNGCTTGPISVEVRLPRPYLVRKPGGIREYYEYDSRGDVTKRALFPIGAPDPNLTTGGAWIPTDLDLQKCCLNLGTPQIPAGSLVYQWIYLASHGAGQYTDGCGSGPADAKRCDKPVSVIDPNGNQTDYTYDTAHGGVLTETGPAVNGVRPQTRYVYVQRQAWVKTSGGGYAQTGENVWLLASKSLCKTSAWTGSACAAGAADLVTTTYDYGSDSGPNNLLLRGVVEDSGTGRLNLRTCYAYDAQGNKISETKPLGTGATCP
jgi:hypothetical protein